MKQSKDNITYWLQHVNSLFSDFREHVINAMDKSKRRIFIDNDSDVLFVAHLDTVQKPRFYKKTNKRIYAAGLDDRLGAMIAYGLSNKLNADLLFTDHEESLKTTAQYHTCKDYNWIVEFDRAGSDVVTYDLDNADFLSALSEYWKIGYGSYSDIVDLQTDACCFNIGIGYEQAHSVISYADLKTIEEQTAAFIDFYNMHKDTKFVQDVRYLYNDLYDPDYSSGTECGVCDVCGSTYGEAVFGYTICEDCMGYFMEWQGVL